MKKLLVRFIREDEGQDLIEYALLGGIITAVGATLITALSTQTKTMLQSLCTAIGTSC